MTTRRFNINRGDWFAAGALLALWLLFFWRLLTPIPGDQASLKQGDFSGQFVAFAAYQYDRFSQGEVPLWNPYNNSGFPFIADTQAAVFYPPRLLTIALAALSTGWSYHTLELEMTFHVLAYSLLMYSLLRRLTLGRTGSIPGALVTAIIAAYGGFMTGYAPLQLAIMEAGIWLPLALIGLVEATRNPRIRYSYLALTGLALGLSWLAGHPQTSWFITYLLVAFYAYRCFVQRYHWRVWIIGTLIFGGITFGLAAVQLLPGVEYLAFTARVDLTYDAKGNGFPFRDLLQFIFPGTVSLFSPLYIGVIGLVLAVIGIWRGQRETLFWTLAALIALGLSFGANSVVFPALYNLLPGLRFFRGQERAAYLVTNCLAILAGYGLIYLLGWTGAKNRQLQRGLWALFFLTISVTVFTAVLWLSGSEQASQLLNNIVLSTLVAGAALFLVVSLINRPESRWLLFALIGVLTFELFTVNMDAEGTYDPVPLSAQLSLTAPALLDPLLADSSGVFRIDGFRGLHDNYGSLYKIRDMRGISPLFLDMPFRIIEPEKINPLAWELFAVSHVFSDWAELPVASTITTTGTDRYGAVNLHELSDARPFAHLLTDIALVDSDEFALALLQDPDFEPRTTVILNRQPTLELAPSVPRDASAEITDFQPERITLRVTTSENVLLTLAHPDYPGWSATRNDEPLPISRAYGALSAVEIPAGEHEITLRYDPLSYRFGAVFSLVTWMGLGILVLYSIFKRLRSPHASIE